MPALLSGDETELVGTWSLVDGKMTGDSTCDRIRELERDHLVRLADDPSGWERLYRDPGDGRLWERTFPQGHRHTGGPPMLRLIAEADARTKYRWKDE